MVGQTQERHWITALLLMFTAAWCLIKPALWLLFAVGATTAFHGELPWEVVVVLPLLVGFAAVLFAQGVRVLRKSFAAVYVARTASALFLPVFIFVFLHPHNLVEGWLSTGANLDLWIAPFLLDMACVISSLLALRSERLLTASDV